MVLGKCSFDGIHYRQEYVKCGKAKCRRCLDALGHGPYWYAYTRRGVMLKKTYVGKALPAAVEECAYNVRAGVEAV